MANQYRVMIVDDERDIREILGIILSQKYEVVYAQDGVDALAKLELYEPDLFLLDIMMPVMDGFQTCEAIRRIPRYAEAHVVFVSCSQDPQNIRKTYEKGGSFFIPKPFTPERVLRNLEISLENAAPPSPKKHTVEQIQQFEAEGKLPKAEQPAATARVKPSAAAPAAPNGKPPAPAETVKARVMVVDDDEDIQVILRTALSRRFEVLTVSDGREAATRIMDIEPDLMILDIEMPRMDGYELCESLRRTSRFHDLPIMFLSARSSSKDVKRAGEVGGTGYIHKPCSIQDVERAIAPIVNSPTFRIRPKKRKLEELLDPEALYELKRRAKNAAKSVERDYGELKKFIEDNFMRA